MNLFWSTHELIGQSTAEHLTEFVAAALQLNRRFQTAFIRHFLARYARQRGWEKPVIVEVETQIPCPGTSHRADMGFVLADGHIILFVHSIDDPEDAAPKVDAAQRLEACLKLNADGIVHIRASETELKPAILQDERYIAPAKGSYFRWRDIYALFEGNDNLFVRWLREGFGPLGLTPPHPMIGDLEAGDPDTRAARRREFAAHWTATREAAKAMGWKIGVGDIVDLYLSAAPTPLATSVFISPMRAGRFLLRITPFLTKEDDVLARIEAVGSESSVPVEVKKVTVWRQRGRIPVVDVLTSVGSIVGAETTQPEAIADRLRDFVSAYLQALRP